jgi:hypothetical protein
MITRPLDVQADWIDEVYSWSVQDDGVSIAKFIQQDDALLFASSIQFLHALNVIAMGNTDPDRMVEIARNAIKFS